MTISRNARITTVAGAVILAAYIAALSGVLPNSVRLVAMFPAWMAFTVVAPHFEEHLWRKVVAAILPFAFWMSVTWTTVFLIDRKRGKAVALGGSILVCCSVLAFLPSSYTTETGNTTFHRTWGMVTRVTSDSDLDDRIDYEAWYSVRRPYLAHRLPDRSRSDRNLDGRWDTWIEEESRTLTIDTDGDEVPDMTLRADDEGIAEAEAIRGY